jgi:hypothetical protein
MYDVSLAMSGLNSVAALKLLCGCHSLHYFGTDLTFAAMRIDIKRLLPVKPWVLSEKLIIFPEPVRPL